MALLGTHATLPQEKLPPNSTHESTHDWPDLVSALSDSNWAREIHIYNAGEAFSQRDSLAGLGGRFAGMSFEKYRQLKSAVGFYLRSK
jgi:hypothetical protein